MNDKEKANIKGKCVEIEHEEFFYGLIGTIKESGEVKTLAGQACGGGTSLVWRPQKGPWPGIEA